MTTITLTPDQLKRLNDAGGDVVLVDADGQQVGCVSPPLPEREWEAMKARIDSDGPWYTTAEVITHLQTLGTE
jgi:hypothetical protein